MPHFRFRRPSFFLQEDTIAPTSVPPGATYYDGFELANFPNDPEWSVFTSVLAPEASVARYSARRDDGAERRMSSGNPGDSGARNPKARRLEEEEEESTKVWALSTEEADAGVYSIRSPDLDVDAPASAYATLSAADDWGEGSLHFSLLWDLDPYPGSSDLLWRVDGEVEGRVPFGSSDGWEEFRIDLEKEAREVTWEYAYDPGGGGGGVPAMSGAAFLDEVYFVPAGASPTLDPTRDPTASPASNPTPSPVSSPTLGPTARPAPGPTLGPSTSPTSGPSRSPAFRPTIGPTPNPAATCPATEDNCLPGGCEGVCNGATGTVGARSCRGGDRTCVDLRGNVGADSCFGTSACKELTGELFTARL